MNCRNCGSELPSGAMFCGECGATVTAPRLVEPATRARPGDTVTLRPLAPAGRRAAPVRRESSSASHVAGPELVEHVAGPEPVEQPTVEQPTVEPVIEHVVEHVAGPEPVVEPVVEHVVEPVAGPEPVVEPIVEPIAGPEPMRLPAPSRASRRVQTPLSAAASAPLAMPPAAATANTITPSTSQGGVAFERDHDDVEATRIVRGRQGGERFVLQFSTGENSTVFGSGLVGRNPVLEPGESVDQLIAIVDTGKSVSKTHIEFGQTEGRFWVSDRFSANGTIVRQPDTRPQRLVPGRRQQVARGTRIDIGEQFFVVS